MERRLPAHTAGRRKWQLMRAVHEREQIKRSTTNEHPPPSALLSTLQQKELEVGQLKLFVVRSATEVSVGSNRVITLAQHLVARVAAEARLVERLV